MFFGVVPRFAVFLINFGYKETAFVSIHLLYEAEGTGNITRAHGRKAQSDIESIPLANQDEWHKIVAIETF
jgi:hypothetical protein